MENRMIQILDIVAAAIGAVTGVIALLLLIIDPKEYVAGILVVLVTAIIVGLVLRDLLSIPLKWISVDYYYEILDKAGKNVRVKKVKKFIVKEKHIDTLADCRMTGSGKLDFKSSNLGRIERTKCGGTITVLTHLATPLPKGKKVEHILEYIGTDCLTESTETVTSDVVHRCVSGIHVTFPIERLPTRVSAYNLRQDTASDIKEYLTQGDQTYSLIVPKPDIGSMIVLQWDW